MAARIRLDHAGIAAMLKSGPVATAIADRAAAVASGVNHVASDGPVEVDYETYTTDRAAAAVTILHPAGMAIEAKYGALTRAAAAAGLETNGGGGSDLLDYVTKSGKKRKATRAQVDNWTRGSRS